MAIVSRKFTIMLITHCAGLFLVFNRGIVICNIKEYSTSDLLI